MTDAPFSGNAPAIQEIISRADAKARGLKFYFTGKPCKRGHIGQRYTSYTGCVDCAIDYASNQRANNPELTREMVTNWRVNNPDKTQAYSKKYYDLNSVEIKRKRSAFYHRNKETELAQNAAWKKKNPAKNASNSRNYLARKKGAEGNHTAEQIQDLHKKQNYKCANCFCSIKETYHADHIVALANGGSNWITNIQLLCGPCNLRKNKKDPIAFAQENGRLI